MKNLKRKAEGSCTKKNFYMAQGFQKEESKLGGLYRILKELLFEAKNNSNPLQYIAENIESKLETLPNELFVMEREKEATKQMFTTRIAKIMAYLLSEGFEVIAVNQPIKTGITAEKLYSNKVFTPVMVSETFHMILKQDNKVFAAKIILDSNPFKSKGNNIPENSAELLVEDLLANELTKSLKIDTNVIYPMQIYLWNSDERKMDQMEEVKVGNKGHLVIVSDLSEKAYKNLEDLICESETVKECDEAKCEICPYKELCLYVKPEKEMVLEALENLAKAKKDATYTDDQMAFINFSTGVARVLAGAGSGKTTSVVGRIIRLMKDENLQPKDFLLTTFTEKGIAEIKEKLAYWMKKEGLPYNASEFNITNFNTFGYDIIRKHYAKLGFSAEPKLFDKSKKKAIIAKILDEKPEILGLNYYSPLLTAKAGGAIAKMTTFVDILKNNDAVSMQDCIRLLPANTYGVVTGVQEVINPDTKRKKKENLYGLNYDAIFEVYKEYQKFIYEENHIEFSDQIRLATKLLNENEEIRKEYSYKHITIDEFQDSHSSEMEMIKTLVPNCKSLVVVGDDAQAIYGFRGVTMKNIITFPQVFPRCVQFTLLDNFRSTQEILDVANVVIKESKTNVSKDLKGHKPKGELPWLNVVENDKYIDSVIEEIQWRTNQRGFSYGEVAVLASTRKELTKVAEQLKLRNIPYVMSVSEFIDDSPVIAAINGILKFIQNPTLTLELAKYLIVANYEKMKAQREMGAWVDEQGKLIAEEIKEMSPEQLYEYTMEKISIVAKDDSAAQILFEALELDACNTLETMSAFVQKVLRYKTDLSVKALEGNYNAVTLTTVHAAKGREFKHVILMHEHFDYKKEHDETVRLLFVAITRAMETLSIYTAKNSFIGFEKAIASGYLLLNNQRKGLV